jgi:hypothetical protein
MWSLFKLVFVSVLYFSSFRQHHASILFCVCKDCGAFPDSLLGIMLMLSGTSSFLCLYYVCMFWQTECKYWLLLFLIYFIINFLLVIHLILGLIWHYLLAVLSLPALSCVPCLDLVSFVFQIAYCWYVGRLGAISTLFFIEYLYYTMAVSSLANQRAE